MIFRVLFSLIRRKYYISEPEGDHIYYMKTEIVLINLRYNNIEAD